MKALNQIGKEVVKMFNTSKYQVKMHSPEILMAAGVVSFVGTVIVAVKTSKKAENIIRKHVEETENLQERIDQALELEDPEYTKSDAGREKLVHHSKFAVKMTGVWAPTVLLGSFSVGCFLGAYNIMKVRYIGAVAAFDALSGVFEKYRERVINKEGWGADRYYMYGGEYSKIDTVEVDENGNTKEKVVEIESIESENVIGFSRIFDSRNPNWHQNFEVTRMFCRGQLKVLNDKLQYSPITWNDLLEAFGFEDKTEEGFVAGWYPGETIDLGLDFYDAATQRRFIDGNDGYLILNPTNIHLLYGNGKKFGIKSEKDIKENDYNAYRPECA